MRKNKKNLLNVVVKNKEGVILKKEEEVKKKVEQSITIEEEKIVNNKLIKEKTDNESLNKIEELKNKYEINNQIHFMNSIFPNISVSNIKNGFFLIVIGILAGIITKVMEIVIISLSNLDDYQKYLYPSYSIIIGIFIFCIFKLNYKIIITSISLFGIMKYIFYNFDELSKIYSQYFIFDIYVISLILLIIFLIVTSDLVVYMIHLFLTMIFNFIIPLCYFIIEALKNNLILLVGLYIWFNWYIITEYIIYANSNLILKILLLYNGNFLFIIFNLLMFSYKETGDINKSSLLVTSKLYEKFYINHAFFQMFKNFDVSKVHENLNFLNGFSFFNLGRNKKMIYIAFIFLFGNTLYGFYNYYNSYQYHKSFFKINNGYCYNIEKDDLILKNNNSNETVFIILEEKIENAYVYKKGEYNLNSIKDKKNQETKNYYIYERKCEKIL